MLEIIILYWVVRRFRSLAEEKGLKPIVWGWIGALSYYIPILIMSLLILPSLLHTGIVHFNGLSELEIKVVFVLINIVTGVLCCMIAYQTLKNKPENQNNLNSELLDDSVF